MSRKYTTGGRWPNKRNGGWRGSGPPGDPKPPALWAARDTIDRPGVWGAYPKKFIEWAAPSLEAQPDQILHICSGAVNSGLCIDIRRSQRPNIVADGTALPLRDGSVRAVMIDPPYTEDYARDLYATKYPRPSQLLAEAGRVVEPGGRIGFLHFLVPNPPPHCRIDRIVGVTTGCGYRIRAFTLFVKEQKGLFS